MALSVKERQKRKIFFNRKKKELLKNIREKKGIKVRLHRVRLTGIYTYNDLVRVGNIHEIGNPGRRFSKYGRYGIFHLGKHAFTVFYNPKDAWLPQCILEISYPKSKTFFDLFHTLDQFKLSYVEYTVDLFFNKLFAIRSGYRILRRYLYFPYQKDGILRLDSDGKYNAYFRAGKIKFYERGDDELKRGRRWLFKDVDRIRIEYGAKNPDLRKLEIQELSGFMLDPKFEAMLNGKFIFKTFKKSTTGVPREFDSYNTQDKKGQTGCFHNEFRRAILNKRNPSQYLQDEEILSPLHENIIAKCRQAGRIWRENIKKLTNKLIQEE